MQRARVDNITTPIIADELPGVLVWALDGLARLLAHGEFTETADQSEMLREFRLQASNVVAFCEDAAEWISSHETHEFSGSPHDPAVWRKQSEMYQMYRRYCETNGCRPCSARKFYPQARETEQIECHTVSAGKEMRVATA